METFICNRCKRELNISMLNEKIVDGTDDIYHLELCDECDVLMDDYFSPEDIDKILKGW